MIGGPHYASDTKFGLGLVAAGLYRTDPNDSILPPSNVSLYGDVSSVGFYMLGVVVTILLLKEDIASIITFISILFPLILGNRL